MHKKIALTALTFLASIALAACSKSPDVTANATGTTIGDTIKVGVNLELTGTVAAYGNAENNGVKLAVQEINKAGGVDGKKIELVTKDNKSENAEASTAATNLAIQSQVNAMIGPATSGAVAAASLDAQKTGVPLVTPSGTQDDLTLDTVDGVRKYVFRTTFQDSFQGQVLAQYAYSNLNAKKVVLYYDNSSDYAKGIAEEFKKNNKEEILYINLFNKIFPIKKENYKIAETDLNKYEDILEISNKFSDGKFLISGAMIDGKVYHADVVPVEEDIYSLRELLNNASQFEFNDKTNCIVDDGKLEKWKYLKGAKRIERVSKDGHKYIYSEGGMYFPENVDEPARTMLTSEGTLNRSSHIIYDEKIEKYRILTPVECEMIQMFPPNWTNTMPSKSRYFMMGNALVTGIIERLEPELKRIIKAE